MDSVDIRLDNLSTIYRTKEEFSLKKTDTAFLFGKQNK